MFPARPWGKGIPASGHSPPHLEAVWFARPVAGMKEGVRWPGRTRLVISGKRGGGLDGGSKRVSFVRFPRLRLVSSRRPRRGDEM